MVIETSRVRKTGEAERTYRGEKEARFLVNELNKEGMTQQHSLRGIIMALQELGCQSMSQTRFWREQEPKIHAVGKILRQYQARPNLRPQPGLRAGFRLEWQRIDGDDLELLAVLSAVKLAQEGRIASLKQCANTNCEQWLFARFRHQRFCSEACKEMFHRTDETDKERRRKWARDNYQIRKERDLGSWKAAQMKGNHRKGRKKS